MIYVKNITDEILYLHFLELEAGEIYNIPDEERFYFATNDDFLKAITDKKIKILDDLKEVDSISKQISLLLGKIVDINTPKTNDGKINVFNTSRPLGTYIYISGSSDSNSDPLNIGGSNSDSELLKCKHISGEDNQVQEYYFDFNTYINPTFISGGIIFYENTKLDIITLDIVNKITPYSEGSNTNYKRLPNSGIIIPANGDGDTILEEEFNFVKVVPNELGIKPPAFWNATFDSNLKTFIDITPAPNGDGEYNLFYEEKILNRFINKFILNGSGILNLPNNDVARLPIGTRLKITTKTIEDNHNWQCYFNLILYREKTV